METQYPRKALFWWITTQIDSIFPLCQKWINLIFRITISREHGHYFEHCFKILYPNGHQSILIRFFWIYHLISRKNDESFWSIYMDLSKSEDLYALKYLSFADITFSSYLVLNEVPPFISMTDLIKIYFYFLKTSTLFLFSSTLTFNLGTLLRWN